MSKYSENPWSSCQLMLDWFTWVTVGVLRLCHSARLLLESHLSASGMSFHMLISPCLSLPLSPGQGPAHPKDPSVAAGLLRPQQAPRACHAPVSADGLWYGHAGAQPPALLQGQPGHLRPHPWSPAPAHGPRVGRPDGQWPRRRGEWTNTLRHFTTQSSQDHAAQGV